MFMTLMEHESIVIRETNDKMVQSKPLTHEQKQKFLNARYCHIVRYTFRDDKLLDNSHLIRNYRRSAHSKCNLYYFFPVYTHNLSGYKSHFLAKAVYVNRGKVGVISNNKELYVLFTATVDGMTSIWFFGSFKLLFY